MTSIPTAGCKNRSRPPNGGNRQSDGCDMALLLTFLAELRTYKRSDLWDRVSVLIRRLMHASGGGVMLFDPQRRDFFFPAVSEEDSGVETRIKSMRFSAGPSPFGELFPAETVSVIHDFKQRPSVFEHMDAQICDYTHNRLDVALRVGDTTIGTLWAINWHPRFSNVPTTAPMLALAGVTATAMERIGRNSEENGSQRWGLTDPPPLRMVHQLSHAIKTPLAVTIASLKLLGRSLDQLPDTRWRIIYDRAERNLARLLTIEYQLEDILRQDEPTSCTPSRFPDDRPAEPNDGTTSA